MPYSVRIVADSMAPSGKRLTTWELTYPRFVHAELMTHRTFSRNSASSRAIPSKKLRSMIWDDPVMPVEWGRNQKGMQAGTELTGWRLWAAKMVWEFSRIPNLVSAWCLDKLGVHKQLANRILEPHMFITVLVTATEFDNWFRLRANPMAQPEIRVIAEEMQYLYNESAPRMLQVGDWHRPFVNIEANEQFTDEKLNNVSAARCARVSYLNHDGLTSSFVDDLKLCDRLSSGGHWSPFEHIARAESDQKWSGNFQGWTQYRELKDPNFTRVGK